jgi:hypothetical protein
MATLTHYVGVSLEIYPSSIRSEIVDVNYHKDRTELLTLRECRLIVFVLEIITVITVSFNKAYILERL